MVPKIAIVALDMNVLDEDYNAYEQKSAREKITLLTDRITQICKELKTAEPDAMWIVTWREYGITDKENKSVPHAIQAIFKQEMQKLSQANPQLTIVAGAMASTKHFSGDKYQQKLLKLRDAYENIEWIERKEQSMSTHGQSSLTMHKQKLEAIGISADNIEMDVVRNTAYIFQGSEMKKHHKTSLHYGDYEHNIEPHNTIHQPGNAKSYFQELTHPVTNDNVRIGIEICLEHRTGVLSDTEKTLKPQVHFVLSDSVDLKLDHMHGDYLVHIDSLIKPQLILSQEALASDIPIHLYQNNFLQDNANLRGPLEPLYPFEKRILDAFDKTLSTLANDSADKEKLSSLRDQFKSALHRFARNDMFK